MQIPYIIVGLILMLTVLVIILAMSAGIIPGFDTVLNVISSA